MLSSYTCCHLTNKQTIFKIVLKVYFASCTVSTVQSGLPGVVHLDSIARLASFSSSVPSLYLSFSVLERTVLKSFFSGSKLLLARTVKSSSLKPNRLRCDILPLTQVHSAGASTGYLMVAVGFTCDVRYVPALIDQDGNKSLARVSGV